MRVSLRFRLTCQAHVRELGRIRHFDAAVRATRGGSRAARSGDAAAQELGAEHARRGQRESAGDRGPGDEQGDRARLDRHAWRQREAERRRGEERDARERQRDGPPRQAEEAHARRRAGGARSAMPGKTSASAAPATASAGGDELEQRGPAVRREAGEGVDAQRLRERRRELDDERELQNRRACEVEPSGACGFSRRFETMNGQ